MSNVKEILEPLIEIFEHWYDLPEIAEACLVPYYVQDGIEAVWNEIKKLDVLGANKRERGNENCNWGN